jgi:hypothetical protein
MRSKHNIKLKFDNNLRGTSCPTNLNTSHDGAEGHYIEKMMGLTHNSKCEPDMDGYELKTESAKTTLGDWSANEYVFSKRRDTLNKINNWTNQHQMSRRKFIETFGTKKNGRYSWSGSCFPIYGRMNECGQIINIDDAGNIGIYYNYEKDHRPEKIDFPEFLKEKEQCIAFWSSDKLKKHVDTKFNVNGTFKVVKNKGVYSHIVFYNPFTFQYFIDFFKTGTILLDSGMNAGTSRNRQSFRTKPCFWNKLICETYPAVEQL